HFGVVPVAVAGDIAVALVGGSLDQAQLPDVPGNGGLGHLVALGVQVVLQLFLAADGVFADQPEDGLQPFGPGPGVFLRFAAHGDSASFVTFTLSCWFGPVTSCFSASGRWPGTGRPG